MFEVQAITGGTIGHMRVSGDHGTGYASRESAELAGRKVAKAAGWESPRVVHC